VAPLAVINTIGQFTTTNGSLVYPEVKQDQLLRRGLVEDSNVSADMTTSGSKFAIYGDWSQFLMVSRTGASIEILPAYGSSGRRPTAQHHYFLTLRVGSDALVPNGFRYLQKS
jgi:predicted phage gp36 major capsid-like protein